MVNTVFKMSESTLSSPHVYYSVSELSVVKDVRVMKNTKVKTIGYIYRNNGSVLRETPDSLTSVAVDLAHIDSDVIQIYPYIIFGILCTVNETPVVVVKFLNKFDLNEADLENYKKQCLLLRNRLSEYDNIWNLANVYNWT